MISGTLDYYRYGPLHEEIGEIRLVTILPGQDGSEIGIDINKCQLSETNKPSYEALSYVWGSADTMANLRVGGHTPQFLRITPNLAECLPYLRLPNEPRTLWVDAICINQQDLEERKHQVGRMADIYKMAKRVVIWLGPPENDSTLALRTLDSLATKIHVDWDRWIMKPSSSDCSELHWGDLNQQFPYQENVKAALKALFNRPWFERLWVQQEIRLGTEAILLSGEDTISWSSLRSTVFCMWVKGWKCGHIVDRDHLELAYNMAKLSYVSMIMLFDNTEQCKCSDNRDRVYALISCLRGKDQIGIEADYTKPVAQVYQETVQRYIERRNRLDILTRCNLSTKHTEMPSWVPNFAMPRGSKTLIDLNADGESSCSAQILGKILKAKGVIGATVNHVSTIQLPTSVQQFVAEVRRLAPSNTGKGPYIGGGTTIEAFASTLYVGEFSSYWLPVEESFQDFAISVEHLQHILDSLKEPLSAASSIDMAVYANNFNWNFKGRAFITTQEGFIGAAPAGVVPGDQVVIFLGCRSPLILRPLDDNQHLIVGECYVPGLLEGESLLGPLPVGYQLVYKYDEECKRYWWAFINEDTDQIEIGDPRLGNLPSDWQRTKSRVEGMYVNVRTGDISDPRLRPDALNSRGVNVRDFFIT